MLYNVLTPCLQYIYILTFSLVKMSLVLNIRDSNNKINLCTNKFFCNAETEVVIRCEYLGEEWAGGVQVLSS